MSGVVLALGAVGLAITAAWAAIASGTSLWGVLLASVLGGVGALVRMPSVTSRRWTLVPPILIACALVGSPPPPAATGVLAGALGTQLVIRLRVPRRAAGVATLAGACYLFVTLTAAGSVAGVPISNAPHLQWAELGMILAAVALWFLIEAGLEATTAPEWRQSPRYHVRRALEDWPIALVATSAAMTFAVLSAHSVMWALVVSILPYGIAHHLGARLARGRHIAALTVRALGRLPEAAGLTSAGHAQHVADLAVAMAKLEGMIGPELDQLETAAHLHDIGLLATTSPRSKHRGFASSEVASWGAEILATSHGLRPAADIVRITRDPFRVPGSDPDPKQDRRAQIIQVACRVVEALETGTSLNTAVEELYEHSLFQLDPHVVSLVRRAALISDSVLDELVRRRP